MEYVDIFKTDNNKLLDSVNYKNIIIYKEACITNYKITTCNTKIIDIINEFILWRISCIKLESNKLLNNIVKKECKETLVCPLFYLLKCHVYNSFDFTPNKKLLKNYNKALKCKDIIEDNNNKLEEWEYILISFYENIIYKRFSNIETLISNHSRLCNGDILSFTIFKVYYICLFGYNCNYLMKSLVDRYFNFDKYNKELKDYVNLNSQADTKDFLYKDRFNFNKESCAIHKYSNQVDNSIDTTDNLFSLKLYHKIANLGCLTMYDFLFCVTHSFSFEEAEYNQLCQILCDRGLEYDKYNLYLIHTNIHLIQKINFDKSIEFFELKTKNFKEKLFEYGNLFIYQHLHWHIAVAYLTIFSKTKDSTTSLNKSLYHFTELLKVKYIDSECFVNVFGYMIWAYTLTKGKINIKYLIENNYLKSSIIKEYINIASNCSFYLKHSLFDYYSVWFLSQLNTYITKYNKCSDYYFEYESNIKCIFENVYTKIRNLKRDYNLSNNDISNYENVYCLTLNFFVKYSKIFENNNIDFYNSIKLEYIEVIKTSYKLNSGSTEQIQIFDYIIDLFN